jgi:hypothetical protein
MYFSSKRIACKPLRDEALAFTLSPFQNTALAFQVWGANNLMTVDDGIVAE